ncbi:hypothetical protein BGZ65_009176 [Modicella reniformis]|uniref:Large subunit GTPase 1 n=1 Tax=Modicella reniformis TaxID=1440133 RepID=A0A9P6MKF4_9FUNG|nr:hypothetical protein BGZ65_009176 [Modicella reniformis]
MVLPKSRKNVGLGNAIIRARFKGRSRPKDGDERLHFADVDDGPSWTRLQSVTQEEKLNIKVISNHYENPFMLSAEMEKETLAKHKEFKSELTVPRRPPWDETTTAQQLQRMEREAFLDWRRQLANLAERENLLLTPFERNLEVWRQLWRVIERSHLVVQIVDARNPLFFRSTDLETYVQQVDPRKKNLLLINKADYLTVKQRKRWADYFDAEGIRYTFFSAALAKERQEKELAQQAKMEALAQELAEMKAANSDYTDEEEEEEAEEDKDDGSAAKNTDISQGSSTTTNKEKGKEKAVEEEAESEEEEVEEEGEDEEALVEEEDHEEEEDDDEGKPNKTHSHWKAIKETEQDDERTRIRDTKDLYGLLLTETPVIDATPGKTKHFQTIHLTPKMILCDCPGLVFPSFVTTQGEMVCNGVLPIDQLREFTGSAGLVAKRIPKEVLEAIYGIKIAVLSEEEGGAGVPTAEEFLIAYAVARGFTKAGQGNPDESRAARYVLKDYVNGKLLFCTPPPGSDPIEFNAEHNQLDRFKKRKQLPTQRLPATASTYINMNAVTPLSHTGSGTGKTAAVDATFFQPMRQTMYLPRITGKTALDATGGISRVQLYPHQKQTDNQGFVSRKMRMQAVRDGLAEMGVEGDIAGALGNKKHMKGKKNVKKRSGSGLN